MKRLLLLPSPLRGFLEVVRVVLQVFREFLKGLGHLFDLRCEFSQLHGELGRFADWQFETRRTNDIARNFERIVKPVDLPCELAKANQTESGNVLEEYYAVDRPRFGRAGLFNDRLDLCLRTDSLRHSDTVGPDLQGALLTHATSHYVGEVVKPLAGVLHTPGIPVPRYWPPDGQRQ